MDRHIGYPGIVEDGGQGLFQLRAKHYPAVRRRLVCATLRALGQGHAVYPRNAVLHIQYGDLLVPAAQFLFRAAAAVGHHLLPVGRDVRCVRGCPVLDLLRRHLHRRTRQAYVAVYCRRCYGRRRRGLLVGGPSGRFRARTDRGIAAGGYRSACCLHTAGTPGR